MVERLSYTQLTGVRFPLGVPKVDELGLCKKVGA
ncbi:MAG: hypothetical protein G01um101448_538 [Parcubacteria group bacterium Gr01-1014_48]|nr:MAG: hypothetical protein Greene041614_638 [Parcubacteria group bacterium Greene0416_14]TSC73804.1 MAG: hypothetical protein G01um101448_538 [Parcubacteria group bacterium Gr01-1014_48]TSD01078.1 MAG: hypothetical protein Greene101415_481 [Parcubacteria group bacterium Greene1014_15]TSD08059.1 MAG: hypothetical protein Greene07144_452 [Parcubacteria group bacterium Greene0714_4]